MFYIIFTGTINKLYLKSNSISPTNFVLLIYPNKMHKLNSNIYYFLQYNLLLRNIPSNNRFKILNMFANIVLLQKLRLITKCSCILSSKSTLSATDLILYRIGMFLNFRTLCRLLMHGILANS